MPAYLIAYLATTVVFFAMDFVWISLAMKHLYQAKLGPLLLEKPNLAVAAGFYLLYVVGIVVFAVMPALAQGNWVRALWTGALFGLVAYGTYDMTNLATLKNWPWTVAVIDMAWGTAATAAAATAGYFITRYFSAS